MIPVTLRPTLLLICTVAFCLGLILPREFLVSMGVLLPLLALLSWGVVRLVERSGDHDMKAIERAMQDSPKEQP